MTDEGSAARRGRRTAGVFDVRTVIAALFAIYGVVLVVMGATADQAVLTKDVGLNINLWAGIGMLVFAALFAVWAWLRPIVVTAAEESGESSE